MIIKNIDGIDERFDHVPAGQRIVPVDFGELMQEKQDAVTVEQLGLGIAKGRDRLAEGFGGILQRFQFRGGGSVPDSGGDGIVNIVDLFDEVSVFRFHRGERRGLHFLPLELHDGVGYLFDSWINQDMIQHEIDHCNGILI